MNLKPAANYTSWAYALQEQSQPNTALDSSLYKSKLFRGLSYRALLSFSDESFTLIKFHFFSGQGDEFRMRWFANTKQSWSISREVSPINFSLVIFRERFDGDQDRLRIKQVDHSAKTSGF